MQTYRKHFFLFISFLICAACRMPLQIGQPGKYDRDCFTKFVPDFQIQWYKASIDVTGKHLSGLLLFKTLPDSSVRVVFTGETGTTFFDLEFDAAQRKVNFVLPQFNRKPVIRTLQNDLDLIFMRYLRDPSAELFFDGKSKYLRVKSGGKTIYIWATNNCEHLQKIEEEWGGKKKVEVTMYGDGSAPDSVRITHYNFSMDIKLRKLER